MKRGIKVRQKRKNAGCILALTLLFLGAVLPLEARGKSDAEFEAVAGESYWTHSVDLTQLEEGKYNIQIRAVDEAGNIRTEGPYDFVVDPETDIPSVGVAHPRPNAKVGRMLPVIGTARDDDKVSRVEVCLDEGAWRSASGEATWSAVLDAGALGDGPHILSVRCFDINNLPSAVVSVPFVVDTASPRGGVNEPAAGTLISGKSLFTGNFDDLNQIQNLEVSKDGGAAWEALKFAKNKETGGASFQVSLDSRELEDGPVIWWFRATDKVGKSSSVPFLFFVDNLGPELVVKLPARKEDEKYAPVPGDVFLAGTLRDLSGLAALQIIMGKGEPIEVPLEEGNPWWHKSLSFADYKGKKAELLLRAADNAGNITETKLSLPLDMEADKAVLTIDQEALEGEELLLPMKGAVLTGTFRDDDGPGSVNWSAGELSGKMEQVDEVWRLVLPELPVGKTSLALVPEDAHGLAGNALQLEFTAVPEAPVIQLDTLKDKEQEEAVPWAAGSVVSSSGASLRGVVFSGAGKELTLLDVSEEGREKKIPLKADASEPEKFLFEIPLSGGEAGMKGLVLKAQDPWGGEGVFETGYYLQGKADKEGNVEDPRQGSPGINFPTSRLAEKKGALLLAKGQVLEGWTSGASVKGAKLEPESQRVGLKTRGNAFMLVHKSPGPAEKLQVVFPNGKKSKTFRVITDLQGPEIQVKSPSSGFWSGGKLTVSGKVKDPGGLKSLSWALKGGSSKKVSLDNPESDTTWDFTFEADVSNHSNGPKILVLKAEDKAGNLSLFELPFVLDTHVPSLVKVEPSSSKPLGAISTLIYSSAAGEALKEVAVTVDGENWTKAQIEEYCSVPLKLVGYGEIPETFKIKAVDKAGNVAEFVPDVRYDAALDKPVAKIQTPVEDSVVKGPLDIAGLIADEDRIEKIYWRMDLDEKWHSLPGSSFFRIPLPLDKLEDGAHLVEVYARDAAGNQSDVDGVWFHISRQEPRAALLSPEVGAVEKGFSLLKGTCRDANGIKGVWISFDQGHSFFRAKGGTDFSILPREEEEVAEEALAEEEGAASELEGAEAPSSEDSSSEEGEEDGAAEEPALIAPVIRDKEVTWTYDMDTSLVEDGVNTILIKVVDGAGDETMLAGILEVDNTPPVLSLAEPFEGSTQVSSVLMSGQLFDEGRLDSLNMQVLRDEEVIFEYHEKVNGVFHVPFNFEDQEPGEVLLKMEAHDAAGNKVFLDRTFSIMPRAQESGAVITLPIEGGYAAPRFVLAGFVENYREGDQVYLMMDGRDHSLLKPDGKGRFFREFSPGELKEGNHAVQVDVRPEGGERIPGEPRKFHYRSKGAWIVLDEAFAPGHALGVRPLISGRTGFEADPPAEDDKQGLKEFKQYMKLNKPQEVEVSVDGGLSFKEAEGREEWTFRIETAGLDEGALPILVRARFNETWAYARTVVELDKTPPQLKLNENIADGRFNGTLDESGTASDKQSLEEVSALLRPGRASSYEVPGFIQGMYADFSVLGATWVNGGIGFTFFQDNVKLQVSAGWSPDDVWDFQKKEKAQARVSGAALGATLLANVLYFPMGYYLGPDWDHISFSMAVGANFTWFSQFAQAGSGMMSSVILQFEVPKIEFPDRKFLTYLAPYLEGRVWFFSSDVKTTPYPSFSAGLRVGLL